MFWEVWIQDTKWHQIGYCERADGALMFALLCANMSDGWVLNVELRHYGKLRCIDQLFYTTYRAEEPGLYSHCVDETWIKVPAALVGAWCACLDKRHGRRV